MAIDRTTKEEWLESFRGATLTLSPVFGNPKVNHMYKRNFDLLGRNGFFISVRGRVLLGEEKVGVAEKGIYDRIAEIEKQLDTQTAQVKEVLNANNVSQIANYNKPTTQNATIISPIQTRYLSILHKADDLLKHLSTLLLHGLIPEREHSKRELVIKHAMRSLPTTVRKITIGLYVALRALADQQKASGLTSADAAAVVDSTPVAEVGTVAEAGTNAANDAGGEAESSAVAPVAVAA